MIHLKIQWLFLHKQESRRLLSPGSTSFITDTASLCLATGLALRDEARLNIHSAPHIKDYDRDTFRRKEHTNGTRGIVSFISGRDHHAVKSSAPQIKLLGKWQRWMKQLIGNNVGGQREAFAESMSTFSAVSTHSVIVQEVHTLRVTYLCVQVGSGGYRDTSRSTAQGLMTAELTTGEWKTH